MAGKIGFVSLGCPKALVDSELILTQLSAEGYETAKDYSGADLVVVNTCGFIDSAVEESLSAIGEALAENGKVIVTGCLGARKNADGSYVLYSIGWNEKDDGGIVVMGKGKTPGVDARQGDWVWQMPAK